MNTRIIKKRLSECPSVRIISTVQMRLTAILVALIIGAPACWWCPMVAAAEKAHHPCCCAHEHGAPSVPTDKPDGKSCTCEMGQAPRDCATDVLFVPTANTGFDYLPAAGSFEVVAWEISLRDGHAVFSDTGPPRVPRPFFQQHHTWLL